MLITKKNNILVLGKDFVQRTNGTTIYAEKLYSINFTENNKNGLNGYVYDFSVDYDAIAVDGILDIHKYLIRKNGII